LGGGKKKKKTHIGEKPLSGVSVAATAGQNSLEKHPH
jgi:hypothetical protein